MPNKCINGNNSSLESSTSSNLKKDFEARLERIMISFQVKSDSELARKLEIKPQSVAAAKQRLQIPTGWIEKTSLLTGKSTDWLFFGRIPVNFEENSSKIKKISETDALQSQSIAYSHYERLQAELEEERQERRELSVENRRLWKKNEELLTEISNVKEENATLRERCGLLEKESFQSRPTFKRDTG